MNTVLPPQVSLLECMSLPILPPPNTPDPHRSLLGFCSRCLIAWSKQALRHPLPGRWRNWTSPSLRGLVEVKSRIEFTGVADESFPSGCSPPRLAATQLPSGTRSQASSRRGLPPRKLLHHHRRTECGDVTPLSFVWMLSVRLFCTNPTRKF